MRQQPEAGMGLFTTPKTRASRRAEARAIKARAKLDARLTARNEARRIKSAERTQTKALKAQLKAQRDSDKAALKVAQTELKAVREGKLLSPTRIKRALTVSRLLAPVLVPLVYRAAITARGLIDERRADRLGVPLSQIGQFSGPGAQFSARIAGAEQSLRKLDDKKPTDAETTQFITAVTARLSDLSAAVTAAENMPAGRRRAAHTAISRQLDGIDADLLARLGLI
jgi:multidrug efflux pump subunit AcrA (membrane-fusion protein)